MIKLSDIAELSDSFLMLKTITDDFFTFDFIVSVDDEQLVKKKLTNLNVSVFSKIIKPPTFETLSDAIRLKKNAFSEDAPDPIKKFSIDLSVGYDSNFINKQPLLVKISGDFNDSNKKLFGIVSEKSKTPVDDSQVAPTLEITKSSSSKRTIKYPLIISRDSIDDATNLYFQFSLKSFKDTGNTVFSQAQVNLSTLISRYNKLTSKPTVGLIRENGLIYANIDVSSDPLASSISVFKKNFGKNFQKLLDITLDSTNAFIQLDVDEHQGETTYRFVNINRFDEESDSYTDVVITTDNIGSPVIYGEQIVGGYRLFARSFPKDVLCARFLYKEMNVGPAQHENTGAYLQITNDSLTADIKGFLRANSLYEVSVECIRSSSVTTTLGKFVFRNIPKSNDGLSVEVSGLEIDSANANVSFKIDYSFKKSDNDILKNLLSSLDSFSLFSDEFSKIKTELEPVVAFQVIRVNLSNGNHDDLGILSSNSFNDIVQSKASGASLIDVRATYRYEIKPLIRFPETVLKNLLKTIESSNKQFTFQPSKFLHPKSLETGTLFSDLGLKTLFSQNEFEFGESSNVSIVRASFEKVIYKIFPNSITQFSNNEFLLTFAVDGDVKNIHHYDVILVKGSSEMVIDRKFSSKNQVFFVVKVDQFDLDFTSIAIEPIFVDSSKGIRCTFTNVFETPIQFGEQISVA